MIVLYAAKVLILPQSVPISIPFINVYGANNPRKQRLPPVFVSLYRSVVTGNQRLNENYS